jgi:hypothetical protein
MLNDSTQTFAAALSLQGYPERGLTWSVSGGSGFSGVITPGTGSSRFTAQLVLYPNNTASSCSVTVASVSNPALTATATVAITDGTMRGPGGSTVYTWRRMPIGFSAMDAKADLVYFNGVFFAGSGNQIGYLAKNSIDWTQPHYTSPLTFVTLIPKRTGGILQVKAISYGEYQYLDQGSPVTVPTLVAAVWDNTHNWEQGRIYYSTDNGATWSEAAIPADIGGLFACSIERVVFHNNTFLAAATQYNDDDPALLASTDGGKTWSWRSSNADYYLDGASLYTDGGKIFALNGIQNKVLSSADGTTWSSYTLPDMYVSTGGLRVVFGNNEILLMGYPYSRVRRASLANFDEPADWTDFIPSAYPLKQQLAYVAGAYGDGVYFLAGNRDEGRFVYSTDNGATWLPVSNPELAGLTLSKVIFVDGDFYGFAEDGSFVYTTH